MTQDGLQSGHPSVRAETQSAHGEESGLYDSSERYDFERLKRAVAFLLAEHERLSSEKAELLEELVERERRLTALESQLETERERRTIAVEGVDKILGRLEQLKDSVSASISAPTRSETAQ